MKKNNTFSFLLTLPFLLMAGSPSLLAADAAAGKKQFKKCKACHSVKDVTRKTSRRWMSQIVSWQIVIFMRQDIAG